VQVVHRVDREEFLGAPLPAHAALQHLHAHGGDWELHQVLELCYHKLAPIRVGNVTSFLIQTGLSDEVNHLRALILLPAARLHFRAVGCSHIPIIQFELGDLAFAEPYLFSYLNIPHVTIE
jgi:hypothetical protein